MSRRHSALTACALFLAAAAPAAADQRIVGGTDAPPDVYDAVAKVDILPAFQCTGTLISAEWVLSAGHCGSVTGATGFGTPIGMPPGSVSVTLGTTSASGSDGETILVDRVVPAPDYFLSESNDIALLHLANPSQQTPIRIAGAGREALWAPGTMQTIAGFGLTKEDGSSPPVMQVAQVPIVDDATCAATYPDSFEAASQICAGYKQGGTDSCQGDSGGPLMSRDAAGVLRLSGATSYGDGCARPDKYGVYARVADAKLREWIRSQVADAIDDAPAATATPGTGGTGSTATTPENSQGSPGSQSGTQGSTRAGAPPAALAATRIARSTLAGGVLRYRVRCGAACAVRVELRADRATARRLGRSSVVLGRVTVRFDRAGRATRSVRIPKQVARRLARDRRARLTFRAVVTAPSGGPSRTLAARVPLGRVR